jgi:thioredoxin reductase
MTKPYDIAIVGGGPAGLTAAIWAGRYGYRVVLVDSGDPRNWETRGINGYLGLPGVRPAELRGRGRDEARRYDVTLLDSTVLRAETGANEEEALTLHMQGGDTLYARRLLLAIGLRDVWPDIPGLEQAYGANAHVCPDCDGYDARDKSVVVIGNGKRALGMALALTTWTEKITILTNGRPPEIDDEEYRDRLEASGIAVRAELVTRVAVTGSEIDRVELSDGSCINADKVYFNIAQRPADDLGSQLGCETDSGGHIVVSEYYATSVRHVYAAGDITPGPQLAIRAASAGAVAAMAMHKSLLPEHRTVPNS